MNRFITITEISVTRREHDKYFYIYTMIIEVYSSKNAQ